MQHPEAMCPQLSLSPELKQLPLAHGQFIWGHAGCRSPAGHPAERSASGLSQVPAAERL